tara:strand:- start:900 stop:1259 length:360 start_codon:yes stop_codon:yes gene_type:complete
MNTSNQKKERIVMKTEMTSLLEAIKSSYAGFGKPTDVRAKMIEEFNENLTYTVGKKYIKILNRGGGVWGFVVNTDDDAKFIRGDILKPAGHSTPTRNSARGNIVTGNFSVCWTGPRNLK